MKELLTICLLNLVYFSHAAPIPNCFGTGCASSYQFYPVQSRLAPQPFFIGRDDFIPASQQILFDHIVSEGLIENREQKSPENIIEEPAIESEITELEEKDLEKLAQDTLDERDLSWIVSDELDNKLEVEEEQKELGASSNIEPTDPEIEAPSVSGLEPIVEQISPQEEPLRHEDASSEQDEEPLRHEDASSEQDEEPIDDSFLEQLINPEFEPERLESGESGTQTNEQYETPTKAVPVAATDLAEIIKHVAGSNAALKILSILRGDKELKEVSSEVDNEPHPHAEPDIEPAKPKQSLGAYGVTSDLQEKGIVEPAISKSPVGSHIERMSTQMKPKLTPAKDLVNVDREEFFKTRGPRFRQDDEKGYAGFVIKTLLDEVSDAVAENGEHKKFQKDVKKVRKEIESSRVYSAEQLPIAHLNRLLFLLDTLTNHTNGHSRNEKKIDKMIDSGTDALKKIRRVMSNISAEETSSEETETESSGRRSRTEGTSSARRSRTESKGSGGRFTNKDKISGMRSSTGARISSMDPSTDGKISGMRSSTGARISSMDPSTDGKISGSANLMTPKSKNGARNQQKQKRARLTVIDDRIKSKKVRSSESKVASSEIDRSSESKPEESEEHRSSESSAGLSEINHSRKKSNKRATSSEGTRSSESKTASTEKNRSSESKSASTEESSDSSAGSSEVNHSRRKSNKRTTSSEEIRSSESKTASTEKNRSSESKSASTEESSESSAGSSEVNHSRRKSNKRTTSSEETRSSESKTASTEENRSSESKSASTEKNRSSESSAGSSEINPSPKSSKLIIIKGSPETNPIVLQHRSFHENLSSENAVALPEESLSSGNETALPEENLSSENETALSEENLSSENVTASSEENLSSEIKTGPVENIEIEQAAPILNDDNNYGLTKKAVEGVDLTDIEARRRRREEMIERLRQRNYIEINSVGSPDINRAATGGDFLSKLRSLAGSGRIGQFLNRLQSIDELKTGLEQRIGGPELDDRQQANAATENKLTKEKNLPENNRVKPFERRGLATKLTDEERALIKNLKNKFSKFLTTSS